MSATILRWMFHFSGKISKCGKKSGINEDFFRVLEDSENNLFTQTFLSCHNCQTSKANRIQYRNVVFEVSKRSFPEKCFENYTLKT